MKVDFDSLQKNKKVIELLTTQVIRELIKTRLVDSHKGSYGHSLLIAGSAGKMGACILAARGTLRAGVGLLTCYVPSVENAIIQMAVPEAMTVTPQTAPSFFDTDARLSTFQAIAVGPGYGTDLSALTILKRLFENYRSPIVLDADALTLLSLHKELLRCIPPGSILTPHPGEFKKLVGEWQSDKEKIDLATGVAFQLNVILILKGFQTLIVTPKGTYYVNTTGNPGMAKGGTGDVLTGVILGLLAQGYSSEEASKIGVFLHGMAGDIAEKKFTVQGMTTSDLIDSLGSAWKELITK